MPYQTLLYDVRNRVATVIINRPEKLNALNALVKQELRECLLMMQDDRDVAVVILTGAGEKSFVAGTDIAELNELDAVSGKEFALRGQEVLNLVENLGKPVIGAINGYALGGGCELALACHLRLASDRARFGQPEITLGAIPGHGGTQRLARLIGKGRAFEMILTGTQIDAEEAYRIGLVNRVSPAAELMSRAQIMGETIASMGQRAISLALQAVVAANESMLAQGFAREADLFSLCCATEDFHEGMTAFVERRKPVFRDR
jgi:enoyl-CoA hydratase